MKCTEAVAIAPPRVLIYGLSNTGKTTLASKVCHLFDKVYFFSLENGHSTLGKLPREVQEKIEVYPFKDTREQPVAHAVMQKVFEYKEVTFCQEHGKLNCVLCKKDEKPFDTFDIKTISKKSLIIIDSLTQLTASTLSNITRGQPVDYKPQFDDYGALGFHLGNILSGMQVCPVPIITISHVTDTAKDAIEDLYIPVFGTRNSSLNVARAFDHVIFTQIKNKKHGAISKTTDINGLVAGSRTELDTSGDAVASLENLFKGYLANV